MKKAEGGNLKPESRAAARVKIPTLSAAQRARILGDPEPVRIAWIRVYEYGGAYTARAKRTGERASCTSSELEAVRRCARKVAARLGVQVGKVSKFGRDLWEATT
jgi:hypothetical protein